MLELYIVECGRIKELSQIDIFNIFEKYRSDAESLVKLRCELSRNINQLHVFNAKYGMFETESNNFKQKYGGSVYNLLLYGYTMDMILENMEE